VSSDSYCKQLFRRFRWRATRASVFKGAQERNRKRSILPRALISSSLPNPFSASAISVTLAMESHSAAFVVLRLQDPASKRWKYRRRAPHEPTSHMVHWCSPWPLLIHPHTADRRSRPQRGVAIKRACIPCILVGERLMKHRIARLVPVRTSRIIP
jgi:hypothetical protein